MHLSQAIVLKLKSYGVKFIFGVPGGGSSLDLIAEADKAGLQFILCRGETSAALMASVVGEVTGTPGVVITGVGPGVASAVNGVAYAWLECAPLILICDSRDQTSYFAPHQVFDQKALFRPITKNSRTIDPEGGMESLQTLIELALAKPYGPVMAELSTYDASQIANVKVSRLYQSMVSLEHNSKVEVPDGTLDLLKASIRPVILIGMHSVSESMQDKLKTLMTDFRCPVFTTYKAKGVIADNHPNLIGHFTGASSELRLVERADLIVLIGVDPVELIPAPWQHDAPLIALSDIAIPKYPKDPAIRLSGTLEAAVGLLKTQFVKTAWAKTEIESIRIKLIESSKLNSKKSLSTQGVVDDVMLLVDENTSFTVDAGAHMVSVMNQIKVNKGKRVLKSTGLSTMGFALPAAIAKSLINPGERVIAFTGDGGLLMCLAELSTAARLGCKITVVVFNDGSLSLIDIKQQQRQHKSIGVRYPEPDFCAAAVALGCRAWKVSQNDSLIPILEDSLSFDGTSLVDISIDPAGYVEQYARLRG